ncbi:MAG: c-type cytochrome [Planctomycetaceae bacterium]|nr:c-type cytochrome [Planctomycetaceae bacterium]
MAHDSSAPPARRWRGGIPLLLVACLAGGCQRAAEVQFVSAPEVEALDPPLRQAVQEQLARHTGDLGAVKLVSDAALDSRHLQRGAAVYARYCVQCHGASGDGAGPAAAYLVPRPRDYRKGIFKFNSTGYGNKPSRDDLLRTIRQGITGTSMPSFDRLPKEDLEAVVDYVLALSQRGELETLLALQADSDGELTPETADELALAVADQWRQSRDNVVEPATKEPAFDQASIELGKEIFQKRECFKCHGRDARGGLAGGIEVGKDAWGQVAAAADLTSGMLHGGAEPLDVYRRIYAGINGTPMPAFKNLLANEPDSVWHLTHYVLDLADQRRRGVQIPLGAAAGGATPPAPAESGGATESPEPAPAESASPASETPASETSSGEAAP